MDPAQLLSELVGEEGPPALLFIDLASRYGLGDIPLPLTRVSKPDEWTKLYLDEQKAGFPGTIGFRRNAYGTVAFFGLWPGHSTSGFPLVQLISGSTPLSLSTTKDRVGTHLTFNDRDQACETFAGRASLWKVVCELLLRASELADAAGFCECEREQLR